VELSLVHESLSRTDDVKPGSDRQFGLVFAGVFTVIGLLPLLGGNSLRWWALGLAVAFLVVALVHARLLRPFNRIWFRFGLLLHAVVSPVVMGLMFFVAVTPVGLIMRALGKDVLRLRFDADAPSYWIERSPPGPALGSMKNQF
jgi:Saxitoxin biosynthesis operon protein SxtJ